MLGQQQLPEAVELINFHENPASESAVPVSENSIGGTPPHKNWLIAALLSLFRRAGGLLASAYNLAAAILVLAVVAAVPLVNFWAMGYLLDAQGRIARGEKWRNAFPDMHSLARIASIGIGMFLSVLPVRLLAGAAEDAHLIAAGSSADVRLHRAVFLLSLVVTATICMALARGGRLVAFFRPLSNFRWIKQQIRTGQFLDKADSDILNFVATLKLKDRFWLGFRGFFAALAWLIMPTALFAAAQSSQGAAVLVTTLGGILLVPVLSWLPLLQAQFAAENRFRAGFELSKVRGLYRKAPLAGTWAVIVTLVLSLPLYLAKIALPPQDAMWMVTLLFILSIYPAKLIAGWAYRRANNRTKDAAWGYRWLGRGVMLPLLSLYVFLLLFTQGIGEHGKRVLFEHHAFLLPVPF